MSNAKYNWLKVTEAAPWLPRDSQGAFVYDNHLWILGGWCNSYEAPPRDVWRSPDGKAWTCVQDNAPWIHSDLPMSIAFKNKMWMMGGWYNGRLPGHSATNAVWSSTDGNTWDQVTPHANWSPRLASGVVVFKGELWILGGIENYYFGNADSLKNDVWHSPDGKQWQCATPNAPWSPRAYHRAVVHDGRIWVIAGGNYVPDYHANNDVWCSDDGVHWEQVTDAAPWGARMWFSSVVYRDHLWVLGGWSQEQDNFGDVWYSKDGKDWHELKSDVIWKSRHEHAAYVFNDRLWVAAGHARPLSNEVWSLHLPADWRGC